MSKLLLLLIVFAIVVWFFARQRKPEAHRPEAASTSRPAEKMVTCARCGVHLPESEAVVAQGHHYCSDEHRQQGPAA